MCFVHRVVQSHPKTNELFQTTLCLLRSSQPVFKLVPSTSLARETSCRLFFSSQQQQQRIKFSFADKNRFSETWSCIAVAFLCFRFFASEARIGFPTHASLRRKVGESNWRRPRRRQRRGTRPLCWPMTRKMFIGKLSRPDWGNSSRITSTSQN